MAMKIETMSVEEFDKIEASFAEDKDAGTETAPCPRCEKKLIKKRNGNSYGVTCETEGCIHYTVRGI